MFVLFYFLLEVSLSFLLVNMRSSKVEVGADIATCRQGRRHGGEQGHMLPMNVKFP
jgi:hypothetical protein